ncbi:MAG: acetyl-CoA hydrolase/transferase family protein [Thermoleophilaceae bacterium]|nr:acetyl-CoA hydrolase/transferase family protein [Thermoleophilaceae bacterium]
MPRELSAADAAALIQPKDQLASGLGPAWPPSLMAALGQRDDWEDLTVDGALITTGTELFNRKGVRYRSGFFGPIERYVADAGGNVEYVPADFRRFGPLLAEIKPRVMATAAAPPDADGWCSLALHAGGTIPQLRDAGADPDRLLIVEVNEGFPRTRGLDGFRHALHIDEIDVLVRGELGPTAIPPREVDETARAIAANAIKHIADGSTLQTGIGAVPEAISSMLAAGSGGNYGIHTEMFNDGLMKLHLAGKITNQKGFHDGISICTFALGSRELYDWLDDNDEVALLPVDQVNDPHIMTRNRKMVTVNGALAVDLYGQVVADTLGGKQFSGTGGGEDFVSGPAYVVGGTSLLCFASTAGEGENRVSRILPQFPAGTVVTTPRHQLDVVVTEFGSVDLATLTVAERARALASIAHPDFRPQLEAAAAALS